jgi:hypothetical protein
VALIDPRDVRRLFQGLVAVLAERGHGRLQAPFQVAELYQQIIPYRAHRARLGFDTNQDYEAAVLGLLAGVGGFATVEPVEAQESLAAEAAFPNPNPGLFREFAGARVRLNPARVRELLDHPATYAPPEPEPESESAPAEADPDRPPVFLLERDSPAPAPGAGRAPAADGGRCRACGQALPGDRAVVFCPWCGRAVGVPSCTRCGDEVEAGWRFCPRCGAEQRG